MRYDLTFFHLWGKKIEMLNGTCEQIEVQLFSCLVKKIKGIFFLFPIYSFYFLFFSLYLVFFSYFSFLSLSLSLFL